MTVLATLDVAARHFTSTNVVAQYGDVDIGQSFGLLTQHTEMRVSCSRLFDLFSVCGINWFLFRRNIREIEVACNYASTVCTPTCR